MHTLHALLLATALVGLGAGCREPAPEQTRSEASPSKPAPIQGSPTQGMLPPSTPRLDGEVVELLPAGGYTYLRLASAEQTRWVVLLGDGPPVGQHVEITNMGEREGFRSNRLGRDFDHLTFGTLADSEEG